MLRRLEQVESLPSSSEEGAFPSLEQPFTLADRPPGVCFYRGSASFFHPYALLQTMSFQSDVLMLSFVSAEVTLTGRGLHALYVQLAVQRVSCVVEQGDRYAVASEALTHIRKIEQILK